MELKLTLADETYIVLERLARAYGIHAVDLLTRFATDATAWGNEYGTAPEDFAVSYLDRITDSKPTDFYSWAVRSYNADLLGDLFEYIELMDKAERTPHQEHYLAHVRKQLDGLWEEYCRSVAFHDLDREEAMKQAREQCKIYG